MSAPLQAPRVYLTLPRRRHAGGLGAASARVDLLAELQEENDNGAIARLPNKKKVSALFTSLSKEVYTADTMNSAAGMLGATGALMVANWADLQLKTPFEVVCLGTFSQLVTVKETKIVKARNGEGRMTEVEETHDVVKLAIASVFSCRAAIEFIIACHAAGISIALQADGTYRLLNIGWVLLVLGLTYNDWVAKEHRVVHHFAPLLHALCFTECKETYEFSMRLLAEIPEKFAKPAPPPLLLGGEDVEAASQALAAAPALVVEAASPAPRRLKVASVNIDCCSSIANAVMAVWALALILNCWVHLARKFDDKIMNLNHQKNHETIKTHVYALHGAVCGAQFAVLLAYLSSYWKSNLDEPRYAKAFLIYYAGKVGTNGIWRRNWFKTASNEAGVVPNSQPIESYNGKIKVLLGAHALYATLSHFFEKSLPRIIINGAEKLPPVSAVTQTPFVPITSELASDARQRAEGASPSVFEVLNVPAYVIDALNDTLHLSEASSIFLVNRGENSTPITAAKAKSFFETMKIPSGGGVVTEAKVNKLLGVAGLYNVVSVTPTLKRENENQFLSSILDRKLATECFLLDSSQEWFFECTSTGSDFYSTGSSCVAILTVFVYLNLVNAEVLTKTIVPRKAPGRPQTRSDWNDRGPGTKRRDDQWFLGHIRKAPHKHHMWRVVVEVGGMEVVGEQIGVKDLKKRGDA